MVQKLTPTGAGPRIAAIDTVLHDDYPNVVHVLVTSDDGATGLGETFFNPQAVSEYVHSVIAPAMLGEPAANIASMWQQVGYGPDGGQAFSGFTSVNASATSALDIAMWDLRARQLGLPLHEALGGAVRDRIRLYNTCADPGHLPPPGTPRHEWRNYETWGLGGQRSGRYADWTASIERPGELARELVDAGITAMKIYPFMRLREMTGLAITPRQLEENVELFRDIRHAVGNRIDVCVDLANMWAPGPALQIATALEEFGLMWLEDPLRVSSVDALGVARRARPHPDSGPGGACRAPVVRATRRPRWCRDRPRRPAMGRRRYRGAPHRLVRAATRPSDRGARLRRTRAMGDKHPLLPPHPERNDSRERACLLSRDLPNDGC